MKTIFRPPRYPQTLSGDKKIAQLSGQQRNAKATRRENFAKQHTLRTCFWFPSPTGQGCRKRMKVKVHSTILASPRAGEKKREHFFSQGQDESLSQNVFSKKNT